MIVSMVTMDERKKMANVKNGTAVKLPKGSTDEQVLDAGVKAVAEATKKAAARGRDWYGTVTVNVEDEKRPYIVKVFADGIALYKAVAIRERQVRVTMGKTKPIK